MDPVTHALSGAVMTLALPAPLRTRWMPLWGAVVAACPDIDIFFSKTPLEYILWHRGITHSLAGAAVLAVLCALLLLAGMKAGFSKTLPGEASALGGWSFRPAWIFSFLLLLLHIWLDCSNSYGTQVFLPFSETRVRLSGLFIVDAALIVPYLCGVLFFRKSQKAQISLLAWSLIYPAGACLARPALEYRLKGELPPAVSGEPVEAVHLTPDLFAPFFWKIIVDTPRHRLTAPYVPFTVPPMRFNTFQKPPEPLWGRLIAAEYTFHAYGAFSQFPVLETSLAEKDGARIDIFTDLRFGSDIRFVNRIQRTDDPDMDKTFRVMAKITRDGRLAGVRFRSVPGAGGNGDTGWQSPRPWPPNSLDLLLLRME